MSRRPSLDRRFAGRSHFPRLGDYRCSCALAGANPRHHGPRSREFPWMRRAPFVPMDPVRLQNSNGSHQPNLKARVMTAPLRANRSALRTFLADGYYIVNTLTHAIIDRVPLLSARYIIIIIII